MILLMEKILHHLRCPKRSWYCYKKCISGIVSGAGFFPSTVWHFCYFRQPPMSVQKWRLVFELPTLCTAQGMTFGIGTHLRTMENWIEEGWHLRNDIWIIGSQSLNCFHNGNLHHGKKKNTTTLGRRRRKKCLCLPATSQSNVGIASASAETDFWLRAGCREH